MSETYRLTGDDSFILWGRAITDLADGDVVTIVADNNIASSVSNVAYNSVYFSTSVSKS